MRKVKFKRLKHIGIITSEISRLFVRKFGIKISFAAVFGVDGGKSIIEYHKKEIEDWKRGIINHLSEEDDKGNAILPIIWRRYPFAKYSIAKIPGLRNTCHSESLLKALKWMIDEVKPEVINIGMGTTDAVVKEELYYLTEKAKENGIIIYTSGSRNISFPAIFDTVIMVMDEATIDNNCSWLMQLSADKIVRNEEVEVWEKDSWKKERLISDWSSALVVGL